MKPVLEGFQVRLELVVTPEMTVSFDELGPLHPVYATYQMARHFEEAGRKLLLPHLEPGEEGIGSSVAVEHTASALVGMRVTIMATFDRVEGRRLFATMEAVSELGDRIGTGSSVQVVLPRERIEANFQVLEARWRERPATPGQEDGQEEDDEDEPMPDFRDSHGLSDHD